MWNKVERKNVVEYFNEERGERRLFLKLESGHLNWDKKKGKVTILNRTKGVLSSYFYLILLFKMALKVIDMFQ